MLPKKIRLNTRLFGEIMKKGATFPSLFVLVRIIKGDYDPARFSAVASKKIAKKAVQRNALRRKIYLALEPIAQEYKKDLAMIVFANTETEKASIQEITDSIRKVLEKVREKKLI